MKKDVVNVEDVKIAISESEGEGRDVLLIHGNSLSSKSYLNQIGGSIGEKFHVIALDLPGHGNSPPATDPRENYSLPGYSEVVSSLISLLNLSNLVIVGHSLGGHIALEVSVMSDEINGILIFGTPPLGIPPAVNDAFLDQRFDPILFVKEGTQVPQIFIDDVNNTDPNARKYLMRNTAKNKFNDEINIVANLKIPLAIIHGTHDKIISLEYIKNLHMPTLWRKTVQIIENAGHSPQWETPDDFNIILKDFLEESR